MIVGGSIAGAEWGFYSFRSSRSRGGMNPALHGSDLCATSRLFLIKREVVIGNAEGEDGHGGGVGGAGGLFVGGALGPGTVGGLVFEERVAERRVDAVPIFATELVSGL